MPGVADRSRMLVAEGVSEAAAGYTASLLLVLFVALYHCLVWLLRRQLRGYLWFAITTALIVAWMGVTNLHSTELLPLSAVRANVVGNFVGSLVNAAFISFLWWFVPHRAPTRPWRILQVILVAIAFVGFVPQHGLALTVAAPVVVAKVLTPLVAMVQLIVWMVRKERDARLLLFGTVVGAVVAPLELYFEQHGIHLSVTPAQAGLITWILVMAVGLASQFSRTLSDVDQRNRELRDTNASIARFVPFGFLDALGKKSVAEVRRGEAQQHEMAVMFCDIRGFTTLAESLGPLETFGFINEYLARMEPEIYRGSGFINQYLGDGIMALFPSSTGPSARSGADGAVAAAIGMANALAKLNAERARAGKSEVKTGAGVHMGALMIGTIGGGEQLDGGVIGDCVNASARLEGMTKMYDARVLISGSVISRLERERPTLRHLDTVRAKGKTEAMLVSEILDVDPHAELKTRSLSDFVDAQRAYRTGAFDDAKRLFQLCLDVCPNDGAARLLLERCDELLLHPPTEWTGVYTLTSK
ncbi:MAG: adenylate/guanylate cyclase domain-containing protein [Deltaproteobacteria bacterium]|nr:adenylate/guanylate cyclase domain-containing protein [Deltaproteobacteria bacterium]